MKKQERYTKIIVDYLESHPAVSATGIETDLALPSGTIRQGKAGRNIPSRHIFSILCHLSNYGLEIDGYDLSYDPMDDTLSARKWIRNVKDKEVKEKGGSYFVYTVEELRWMASDFHDLP